MKTYTRASGERVVMAKARIVPPRGYEQSMSIVVDQCPFCLHTHRHSYSGASEPFWGIREADCFKGQYVLVDEDIFDGVGND